jgi:hypothetical protein
MSKNKDKEKDYHKNKHKEHELEELTNIHVNVYCSCGHQNDKNSTHMTSHNNCKGKNHNGACHSNNQTETCPRIERRVNDPADDVTNFPRITQSETSLAYYDRFILYGFNDSNDAINNSTSGFAFSNDFGQTWVDGGSLPTNTGGSNDGDPVIAVDRNGIFYYGQIGSESVGGVPQGVISVSTGTITPNEAINMNPPQVVGRGQNPVGTGSSAQDKEWITIGPDADNPGSEALYVTWTDFTTTPQSIRFSKYTTGVNLTPIITDQVIVPPTGNEFVSGSYVIVDDLGGIYVFYERIIDPNPGDGIPPRNYINTPNRTIRMLKSTDGGNTFPINIAISNPFAAAATDVGVCNRPSIGVDNDRRIRMNDYPHAAIGPDGTIYVVWNEGRVVGTTTFIDVYLAYSTDKGNSWNRINVTSNTSTFPFFPTVAANHLGAHVQYNRFNDRGGSLSGIGDGTFAIFLKSFTLNDGLSDEKMISTIYSEVPVTNPNPDFANCYMGDYNAIIAGPGNCLLHAWGDNRDVIINGTTQFFNPDVFFAITGPSKNENGCSCDCKTSTSA